MKTTTTHTQRVTIPIGRTSLIGDLSLPDDATGIVVFVHGSGSSRTSSRNQAVAAALNAHGLGTLLFDLLTPDEVQVDEATRHLRFDIGFLANRLGLVTDWLSTQTFAANLAVGLFGASTGAAAALVVAASRPTAIRAVVSRGGRPDLALPALAHVRAPTLLIVGGADLDVIPLNERALRHLPGCKDLVLVDRATHLFEEPGTLDEVARLAGDWFDRYLSAASPAVEPPDDQC